jgi:hypothetical protein
MDHHRTKYNNLHMVALIPGPSQPKSLSLYLDVIVTEIKKLGIEGARKAKTLTNLFHL